MVFSMYCRYMQVELEVSQYANVVHRHKDRIAEAFLENERTKRVSFQLFLFLSLCHIELLHLC